MREREEMLRRASLGARNGVRSGVGGEDDEGVRGQIS
jgi:hypothetical protein